MTETPDLHPATVRRLPAWLHRVYAAAKDWARRPDISSWRTCPRCLAEFGLHELGRRRIFHVYEPLSPCPRPLCPSCTAKLSQAARLPRHACARCGFQSHSAGALVRHLTEAHGHPAPRPVPLTPTMPDPSMSRASQDNPDRRRFEHLLSPGPLRDADPMDQVVVTIHPCDGLIVAARNTDGNTPSRDDVVKALRAAADRVAGSGR